MLEIALCSGDCSFGINTLLELTCTGRVAWIMKAHSTYRREVWKASTIFIASFTISCNYITLILSASGFFALGISLVDEGISQTMRRRCQSSPLRRATVLRLPPLYVSPNKVDEFPARCASHSTLLLPSSIEICPLNLSWPASPLAISIQNLGQVFLQCLWPGAVKSGTVSLLRGIDSYLPRASLYRFFTKCSATMRLENFLSQPVSYRNHRASGQHEQETKC